MLSGIPTKRNQLSTDVRRSTLSFKKGASYGALSFGKLQDAYLYKKKFRFPPAKQKALHSLEPKACRPMSPGSYRPANPKDSHRQQM